MVLLLQPLPLSSTPPLLSSASVLASTPSSAFVLSHIVTAAVAAVCIDSIDSARCSHQYLLTSPPLF
ncbi:unnamed protein product [Linum trigynum]|uniref:Secreted peptide n=1 Tax=Linum trigynum TaxID=586398 RepID=A0AAV2CPY5_9ROSI